MMDIKKIGRRSFIDKVTKISVGANLLPIIVNEEKDVNFIDFDKNIIPGYLKGYENIYKKDPRSAAIQWFRDAKFGLFVHFNLVSLFLTGRDGYSIAENALKGSNFSIPGLLFKRFKAEKFNAGNIADLAVAAHMRYINFTTQHRGDMRMWKTGETDFNSWESPANKDFIAEMSEACQKKEFRFFPVCSNPEIKNRW